MNEQHESLGGEKQSPAVTHSTTFGGPVNAGAISTGSGAIYMGSAALTIGQAANREEFVAALRAFKAEVERARAAGLPADTADDVAVELEAAERETQKDHPAAERLATRLKNAKQLLSGAATIATAAAGAGVAAGQLLPWFESALNAVTRLFG